MKAKFFKSEILDPQKEHNSYLGKKKHEKKIFLPPAGIEPTTPRLQLTENQIVKNGGVRGDADTPAHHDGYFEFVPILVTATKGAFNAYFGRIVLVLLFAINSFVKAEKN